VASTKVVRVGNFYGIDPTTAAQQPISRILLINKSLSASEIATLYEELMVPSAGAPKPTGHVSTPAKTTTAPALHWMLGSKIPGTQTFPDSSASNLPGTAVGVGQTKGWLAPEAAMFWGNAGSYITRTGGLTSSIPSDDTHTIEVCFKATSLANAPVILASSGGASDYYVKLSATAITWAIGGSARVHNVALRANEWHRLALTKTAAGDNGVLRLDNQPLTVTSGTLGNTPATGDWRLGGHPVTAGVEYAGALQDFKVTPSVLSNSELTQGYLSGARRCTFSLPMRSETEVTLADVTAVGAQIGNTPFKVLGGGTWRITEPKAGKKFVNCAGTQYLAAGMPSKQAFGMWMFDYYAATGPAGMYILFHSNDVSDITSTSRAGYMLGLVGAAVLLYQVNGAAGTVMFSHPAIITAGAQYRFAIMRTNPGVFTVMIKGGAYTKWTAVPYTAGSNPTAPELTFTTCSRFIFASSSTGAVAGIGKTMFLEGANFTAEQLEQFYP
jgi:hypothetical protein